MTTGKGPLFNQTFGIDGVYRDPSQEGRIDQGDEYVSFPELQQARTVYKSLIEHYRSP